MASRSGGKGYWFGSDWIVTLILAIIPVTNIVLGAITRLVRGNILGFILNIILTPVFYVVDLVTVILDNRISFLA